MKIAVSSAGKTLDAQIDPRFGRCAYFIIVETDDMRFDCYENENKALGGGAGIQAAGFVVSKGATAILTGNCGPNAMTAFSAAGVTVYTGQAGTVGEAIDRLKMGGLVSSTQSTVPEKAGVSAAAGAGTVPAMGIGRCRGGSGRGRGMGGGRGMGRGRGMGAGSGTALPDSAAGSFPPVALREEPVAALKRQAGELQRQMAAIQAKIDSME
jgi:predicted Fe-Mo cluster-binding NifX family protein